MLIEPERLEVAIIHSGVGEVNKNDILLAATASRLIVGFEVEKSEVRAAVVPQQVGLQIDDFQRAAVGDLFESSGPGRHRRRSGASAGGVPSLDQRQAA